MGPFQRAPLQGQLFVAFLIYCMCSLRGHTAREVKAKRLLADLADHGPGTQREGIMKQMQTNAQICTIFLANRPEGIFKAKHVMWMFVCARQISTGQVLGKQLGGIRWRSGRWQGLLLLCLHARVSQLDPESCQERQGMATVGASMLKACLTCLTQCVQF